MAEHIRKHPRRENLKVFCGNFIHATDNLSMEILQDHVMGIENEKILFLRPKSDLPNLKNKYVISNEDITFLKPWEFLMPGLVDTHIHAPQYVYTGTGIDMGLLDWLNTYTYPTEAKFSDLKYAEEAYTKAVRRVLKCGTTTACYFATIHTDTALILCDVIGKYGQRAYVGKVNMDQNSPDYYVETTQKSAEMTKQFVEKVLKKNNHLVTPCITPRFAISCTSELMDKIGSLAEKYNLPIQSHLSETKPEVEMMTELFPKHDHYAGVYDDHKLLNNRTVMAHCIHLSDEELQLMKDRGAGISHCPNSNFSIRSGILDMRRILNKGIKCGLGTDVSGGYSPSMLNAIRMSMTASNVHTIHKSNNQDEDYEFLDYKECFKLATLGGSQVLGLDHKIGNFKEGKEFDALLIDAKSPDSPIDLFESDKIEDIIQKFIMLGDDRNIREVYVSGRRVVPFDTRK